MTTSGLLRLSCKTQSYDWGKLGLSSKVAELANKGSDLEVVESQPFAEVHSVVLL